MPGLRYHAGRQVLEAQDSLDANVTHFWPVGSLRGFDLGREGALARRFRLRLVREGAVGPGRREFVEVLTTLDTGPLLLGWLFVQVPAGGRTALRQTLMAGPGSAASPEGLRPLELTQSAVLRLFGGRSDELRYFAVTEHLRFDEPADVARLINYFNRVALVKM